LLAGQAALAAKLCAQKADSTIEAGRSQTLLRWCERLPVESLADQPELLILRARAAYDTGDLELAQAALENAMTVGESRQDPSLIARVLIQRSVARRFLGHYREAIADCRAGLNIARDIGDNASLALGYRQLGSVLTASGSTASSIPALRQALDSYATLDDRHSQGVVCHQTDASARKTCRSAALARNSGSVRVEQTSRPLAVQPWTNSSPRA